VSRKSQESWPLMEIELVVFDIAGTTVNDNESVNGCVRAALEAFGLSVTAAEVNGVMGLPKPEAIAILVKNSEMQDRLGDQIQAIHRDFVARLRCSRPCTGQASWSR
jgi:phosphoglycolate phosphatase-like HAD superfamily hydrolase